MKPESRRRWGVVSLAAGVAVLLLALGRWAFSRRHTPLEYMVGGTLGTGILLAGGFVQIVRLGYLRDVRGRLLKVRRNGNGDGRPGIGRSRSL